MFTESIEGSTSRFFSNNSRAFLLMRLTPARSSSGPSAEIFLFSAFPISPLMREVSSQREAIACHRSSMLRVSQISKAFVGII